MAVNLMPHLPCRFIEIFRRLAIQLFQEHRQIRVRQISILCQGVNPPFHGAVDHVVSSSSASSFGNTAMLRRKIPFI